MYVSELLDKQVNAQKNFQGSHKLPQAHKKVCDENDRKKQRNRKKQLARKNIIDGRRAFIGYL